MRDVQNEKPEIEKIVDKVGVREFYLPYTVQMRGGGTQNVIANISAYVTLTEQFRGINMSRIPLILHEFIDKAISSEYVDAVLKRLCEVLESPSSYLKIHFLYFLKKKAPVSGTEGYVYYPCVFEGSFKEGKIEHYLTLEVPYLSLCECSKEISEYGAHNQGSTATIKIAYSREKQIWIEELVELVDRHASAPVYSILKRRDEKWVTEHSYKNPRFVETMARRISHDLEKDERILGFTVIINHHESIHQHYATAVVHGRKGIFIP